MYLKKYIKKAERKMEGNWVLKVNTKQKNAV